MAKKQTKNNDKIKIIILILLIIIVSLTGVLFYLVNHQKNKKNNKPVSEEKLNKNQLAVKMNAVLNFENYISTSTGIENPENNNYDVIITIYVDGQKNPIYKSSKISPGEKLEKIKINKIPKGKYNAIAYFNAYDDENNYKGKSGVEIILNIN